MVLRTNFSAIWTARSIERSNISSAFSTGNLTNFRSVDWSSRKMLRRVAISIVLSDGSISKCAVLTSPNCLQCSRAKPYRTRSCPIQNFWILICCISETCIPDSPFVITLSSPDTTPFSHFTVRISHDLIPGARCHIVFGIDLSVRAERTLLNSIPVNSRMCVVRLKGSVPVSSSWLECRCLFVMFGYHALIAPLLRLKTSSNRSYLD